MEKNIALAVATIALGGSAPCLAGTFTYTVLASPYPNMTVTGVNSKNQIVGYYYTMRHRPSITVFPGLKGSMPV